mmetsp:Transcript_15911/g.31957  ORF Transcript_15911/g.31957 Transcript_15911/m.31957 type:complete len:91 (+) Transcript_15911:1521-1793(+)
MPSFFLILVRFWLRVDGIAVRSIETRWFHIFGQGQVIREQVHKCASSQIVAELPLAVLQDPEAMQIHLRTNSVRRSRIDIPSIEQSTASM